MIPKSANLIFRVIDDILEWVTFSHPFPVLMEHNFSVTAILKPNSIATNKIEKISPPILGIREQIVTGLEK